MQCFHCGEDRHDIRWAPGDWPQSQSGHWEAEPGQPEHDPKRCWTIAHARAADMRMNGLVPTEADHHIAELARWLRDRPMPKLTPAREDLPWFRQMARARADRETALNRWVAIAQRETSRA